MPEVIRGIRSNSNSGTPTNSTAHNPRVTFEQSRDYSNNSLRHIGSPDSLQRNLGSGVRRSSQREHEERDAFYDSRAASQKEYKRRASNLQAYYLDHPDLLPQLPFTFRHGFKRWRLAGYISFMVIDACVVPIVLYYGMTFGGNIEGYITFAVITAIWGGPTYVEFAIRSLRLIKKEHFYKPLGVEKRWAFDITNWILILFISTVTALLIIGAAPHEVFLRVLSMPGPAILFCLSGPIFFLSVFNMFGWKAPFQISSTKKGDLVLPGVYYILEDIVAVNAGGGRPFREGLAARYNASPIFRKMLRDQSWFWSVGGILMGIACTIVVCIQEVKKEVAYGIGWGVPFLWAGIWAAITVTWVRSVMHRETVSWEEESAIMTATMPEPAAPPAAAPGHYQKGSASLDSDQIGLVKERNTMWESTPEGIMPKEAVHATTN
ncbi:hypothetical protein BJ878DRAFT_530347 [Calycina marina]|uniref:Uncharacterized protein n=1 Tax=Calycina marina TaxID=1763456 RepID=A0A9P7YUC5_9HELO|nr:hypothetical protein BJ878DRAFT_530347 [Calycina marina]